MSSQPLIVHYRCRNWSTIASSSVLAIFATLLLIAVSRTELNNLGKSERIFCGMLLCVVVALFVYAYKGARLYFIDKVEDIVLDNTKIIYRQNCVRWADIQHLQVFHNTCGACISISILTVNASGRKKRILIPMSPGVSKNEIQRVIVFVNQMLNIAQSD